MSRRLTVLAIATAFLTARCGMLPSYMAAEREAIERSGGKLRIVDADGHLMDGPRALIEKRLGKLDADGSLTQHLSIAGAITEAPLVVGNATDILIDGPQAYAAMFAAIDAARDHIHIESFIFEELDFHRKLSDVLIAKRRSGVTIRVLYDSVGSLSINGLPPPPTRRTRPSGSGPSSRSSSPRLMVERATPVIVATIAKEPYPAAWTSAAANNRRPRSSSLEPIDSHRCRMPSSSIMA